LVGKVGMKKERKKISKTVLFTNTKKEKALLQQKHQRQGTAWSLQL
jgi:hypothetical protein